MWVVFLLLLVLLSSATAALADPSFSEKYERDFNIFNPTNRYNPGNSFDQYNNGMLGKGRYPIMSTPDRSMTSKASYSLGRF